MQTTLTESPATHFPSHTSATASHALTAVCRRPQFLQSLLIALQRGLLICKLDSLLIPHSLRGGLRPSLLFKD